MLKINILRKVVNWHFRHAANIDEHSFDFILINAESSAGFPSIAFEINSTSWF
jgi:hypothetical protein